jgi:hypothetical protein
MVNGRPHTSTGDHWSRGAELLFVVDDGEKVSATLRPWISG